MEPLQSEPTPALAIAIEINATNSWPTGEPERPVRLAFIATDSSEPLSFVTLQSATRPEDVLRVASRPSRFEDLRGGLVVELHLVQDLAEGDSVSVSITQPGATSYFAPQQIDDTAAEPPFAASGLPT